jgi:cobalt transporter subunit CbtA
MAVFRSVVFLAALAGLVAGVAMTGLQSFFTVPLILKAETYENAAPAPSEGQAHDEHEAVAGHHHHDEEAWMPRDGLERTAFTALANIVTAIGFALVLVVASEFAGGISGWASGMIWGFAGFGVFTLAPGLGLPPELPGMPAAELAARQQWWIFTVVMTAAGLALIAFRRKLWLALLGVALIVVPHVIGAPQPATHESPVPASLHHQFVVATTLTSLVFWLILGAAAGALRQRFVAGLEDARQSLA